MIDSFLDKLERFAQGNKPQIERPEILAAMDVENLTIDGIRVWLSAQSESWWKRAQKESHETTTHYKWLIWEASNGRYQLWLHEYKPSLLRRIGYANTAHNHRYWFASRILRGGFRHLKYSVPIGRNSRFDPLSVKVLSDEEFGTGDRYQLILGEIHSLKDIKDGTMTFVVQSSAERKSSKEFVIEQGVIISHVPIPSRRRFLIAALSE